MALYAFTEIMTLSFDAESGDLENPRTPLGRVWTGTIKKYVGYEHTGTVRWGVVHDSSLVKLVIDWNTQEAFYEFKSGAEYRSLLNLWDRFISITTEPILYNFHHSNAGFDSPPQRKLPLTIITFKFPPGYDPHCVSQDANHLISGTCIVEDKVMPRTNAQLFADAWQQLWETIGSKGASFNGAYLTGWSVDIPTSEEGKTRPNPSYCISFLTRSAETLKMDLEKEQSSPQMKFLLSTASAGFELEFSYMRCFDMGWHGSVTSTFELPKNRHSPPRSSLIAEFFLSEPMQERYRQRQAALEARMRERGEDPDFYKNMRCGTCMGWR